MFFNFKFWLKPEYHMHERLDGGGGGGGGGESGIL